MHLLLAFWSLKHIIHTENPYCAQQKDIKHWMLISRMSSNLSTAITEMVESGYAKDESSGKEKGGAGGEVVNNVMEPRRLSEVTRWSYGS